VRACSYPTYIEQGIPTARHLVLYFLGRLLPSQQHQYPCTAIMKFSPHEIDMATWLNRQEVEFILNQQNPDIEIDIINSTLNKEGKSELDSESEPQLHLIKGKLSQFFVKNDKTTTPTESLALGSVFVLRRWLQIKNQ
jgi:hypothetical protein